MGVGGGLMNTDMDIHAYDKVWHMMDIWLHGLGSFGMLIICTAATSMNDKCPS